MSALVVEDNGCCALEEGHDGCCAWVCNDCGGNGVCGLCGGDSALDDVTWCELCSGGGNCPYCDEGLVADE